MSREYFQKVRALLLELYKSNSNRNWLIDLIEYSDFTFEVNFIFADGGKKYDFTIKTEPKVFLKIFDMLDEAKSIIKNDIQKISNLGINQIEVKPDYDRFQIINSVIQPIHTDWDEINKLQSNLIQDLKKAKNEVDSRNIGNSCRIILDKLTAQVFDQNIHKAPAKVDLSEGKFKNRLHSFIKAELTDSSNKELRQLSESAVSIAEKTIDLSNNLTHNKKADRFLAEYCSVATLSVISLIRMISNLN